MHRLRLLFVVLLTTGAYLFLGVNLYSLQIEKRDIFVIRSGIQQTLAVPLEPPRGAINFTDKNGAVVPAAVTHEIPKGIKISAQSYRWYPRQTLAAHLLGFVGQGDVGKPIGKYGLEQFYEDRLAGAPPSLRGKKIIPPVPGKDLLTTINIDVQTRAEEILNGIMEKFGAVGGSIIVEEPKTGRIIAMASVPAFDPNVYAKADLTSFVNPVVQSVYEPGSIFKVLTMAAGIDSGAITPETAYDDAGELTVGDRTIKNWDFKQRGGYGRVTMTGVIEHSINTGAVFAERQTGNKVFRDYLRRFGFGRSTEIDLPGELAGDLRNLDNLSRQVHFATASYGQGISVTPLQLIAAVSAIANNGRLMRPTVLAANQPEETRQVITADTARAVTAMMENALAKAKVGAIDKYRLAGKTGTAQVPDFKRGGYTADVINSYVGFGPVSDPRFVIMVKLDKPAGAPLAGQTVVPAFRELAQFILNYYNIAPDDL